MYIYTHTYTYIFLCVYVIRLYNILCIWCISYLATYSWHFCLCTGKHRDRYMCIYIYIYILYYTCIEICVCVRVHKDPLISHAPRIECSCFPFARSFHELEADKMWSRCVHTHSKYAKNILSFPALQAWPWVPCFTFWPFLILVLVLLAISFYIDRWLQSNVHVISSCDSGHFHKRIHGLDLESIHRKGNLCDGRIVIVSMIL